MSYLEKEIVQPTSTFGLTPKRKYEKNRHRKYPINITTENSSILGKRKLVEAFGEKILNEKERYGQDIPTNFFNSNIGHCVLQKKSILQKKSNIDEAEILDWCYKYLASKKI